MLPANLPRPRLFKLRTDDPEKAIDDPALALLAAAGWTAVASFPAEEQKGTERLRFVVIVLWPPRDLPAPAEQGLPPLSRWLVWLAVVGFVAILLGQLAVAVLP